MRSIGDRIRFHSYYGLADKCIDVFIDFHLLNTLLARCLRYFTVQLTSQAQKEIQNPMDGKLTRRDSSGREIIMTKDGIRPLE